MNLTGKVKSECGKKIFNITQFKKKLIYSHIKS